MNCIPVSKAFLVKIIVSSLLLQEDGPRSTRSRVPVKYTTEEYDKKFSEALKEAMDKNKPEKPEKTARSQRKTRSYKEESGMLLES